MQQNTQLKIISESDIRPTLRPGGLRLGALLCDRGFLSQSELADALQAQLGQDVRLGDLLITRGLVGEKNVLEALAAQWNIRLVDLEITPPDPGIAQEIPAETCLKHHLIPWRGQNGKLWIATSRPDEFDRARPDLPAAFHSAGMVLASGGQIDRQITRSHEKLLSNRADNRCPDRFSCRSWAKPMRMPLLLGFVGLAALLAISFPTPVMWGLFALVMINLLTTSLLRIIAFQLQLRTKIRNVLNARAGILPKPSLPIGKLPTVSVLVPLHREEKILPALVSRLESSHYPKELLDICLVIEASDKETKAALEQTDLPVWMRVIEVPDASIKTKPRAMNFALDFCRGSIIGIYDAEDAPEADQIHRFVAKFQNSGADVACIQGYLDFYNPRENWLSRCFTIEYAIWFRVVLHGVEKLKLPVPLGGTTVFFRREALEKLGAWDAHNVTEDADLGMRLARAGYRCAFESTTTYEEANCRAWPWVKQRSRWLKGYAMTWITHMRHPISLWRELGPKGFLTFHILLLGTLATFLLAPFTWSIWLVAVGFEPGFVTLLPPLAWNVLALTFITSELILIVLGLLATSDRNKRFLMPWVFTMTAYWPLGSIAVYKAMYELLLAPFNWDKTSHGHSAPDVVKKRVKAKPKRSALGANLARVNLEAGLKSE